MSKIHNMLVGGGMIPTGCCMISNGSPMGGGSSLPRATAAIDPTASTPGESSQTPAAVQTDTPVDIDAALSGIEAAKALFETLEIPPQAPAFRSLVSAHDAISYLRRAHVPAENESAPVASPVPAHRPTLAIPRHPSLATDRADRGAQFLAAYLLKNHFKDIERCFPNNDTAAIINALFEAYAIMSDATSVAGVDQLFAKTLSALANIDAPFEGRGFVTQMIKTAQLIDAGRAISAVESAIGSVDKTSGWWMHPVQGNNVTVSLGTTKGQGVTADAVEGTIAIEFKLLPMDGRRLSHLTAMLRMPAKNSSQYSLALANGFKEGHVNEMVSFANQLRRYAQLIEQQAITGFELHIVSFSKPPTSLADAIKALFPTGTARVFWHKDIVQTTAMEFGTAPTPLAHTYVQTPIESDSRTPAGEDVLDIETSQGMATPLSSVVSTSDTANTTFEPSAIADEAERVEAQDTEPADAPPVEPQVPADELSALLWRMVFATEIAADFGNDQTQLDAFIQWCISNGHAARIYDMVDETAQIHGLREALTAWREAVAAQAPATPPVAPAPPDNRLRVYNLWRRIVVLGRNAFNTTADFNDPPEAWSGESTKTAQGRFEALLKRVLNRKVALKTTGRGKTKTWDEETEGVLNSDVIDALRRLAEETTDEVFFRRIHDFIWVLQQTYSGKAMGNYFKFGFGDGDALINLMQHQIWLERRQTPSTTP